MCNNARRKCEYMKSNFWKNKSNILGAIALFAVTILTSVAMNQNLLWLKITTLLCCVSVVVYDVYKNINNDDYNKMKILYYIIALVALTLIMFNFIL